MRINKMSGTNGRLIPPVDRAELPELSVDLFRSARRSEEISPKYTDSELGTAIDRYHRFLHLIQLYPNVEIAPSRDIDDIWHLHMLHPVAYHTDCMKMFGYIVDHDGGFGSVPDEESLLQDAFDVTVDLWKRTYGEAYVDKAASRSITNCKRNCVSRCKRACKTN